MAVMFASLEEAAMHRSRAEQLGRMCRDAVDTSQCEGELGGRIAIAQKLTGLFLHQDQISALFDSYRRKVQGEFRAKVQCQVKLRRELRERRRA